MARILLMIESAEDWRIFQEILSVQHEVVVADSDAALEEPVRPVPAGWRHAARTPWVRIDARRAREAPGFFPSCW